MDFSRWAVVSYKDDTGLGVEAKDLRAVLGLGRQLVVPSQRLEGHPLDSTIDRSLSPDFSDEQVKSALKNLEGIIILERSFHPRLLSIAKDQGLKVVAIPNWEWFAGNESNWKYCDLFVCYSRFTKSIVEKYGWRKTIHMPPVVDLTRLPQRRISGQARLFIHNAGLVDADDRKGTRDTINAFRRVNRPDIRLIVRLQKEVDLPALDSRIEVRIGNLPDSKGLYEDGDVAIQPSKMEGIGYMILEPMCAGMPVITLDYPPMNEYVQSSELLVKKQWFKRKSVATQWVAHAHLRLPNTADLARKIEWCAEHDLSHISQRNRTAVESTFARDALRSQWVDAISKL